MKHSHSLAPRVCALAFFVVVLGLLLYAGLRAHPVPDVFHEADKLYHLLAFAALILSARMAFPRIAWWWLVLAALILGAGIEFLQELEPARTGSIWDFLFDTAGIAAGWLVVCGEALVLRRRRP